MELLEIIKIATPLLALGGAWGGTRVALNGTRERVKNLEASEKEQDKKLQTLGEGMVRVETKQDMLIEYIKENKNG